MNVNAHGRGEEHGANVSLFAFHGQRPPKPHPNPTARGSCRKSREEKGKELGGTANSLMALPSDAGETCDWSAAIWALFTGGLGGGGIMVSAQRSLLTIRGGNPHLQHRQRSTAAQLVVRGTYTELSRRSRIADARFFV